MATAEKACRQKYLAWAVKNRIISEYENFDKDPTWLAWQAAWASSRSRAYEIARQKTKERFAEAQRPLSDEEIKSLWNMCTTGKEFAKMIEGKHLIR